MHNDITQSNGWIAINWPRRSFWSVLATPNADRLRPLLSGPNASTPYTSNSTLCPTTTDAAAAMVAAEFQRVDVLVNNAGINAPRRWSAGHGRPENDDFRTPKTTAPISPCPSGASIRPSVMIGYA
jgi:hypothetical protein